MIGQLLSNTNEILQYVTVLNSEFGARATNMAGVAPVLIRLAIFARKKRNGWRFASTSWGSGQNPLFWAFRSNDQSIPPAKAVGCAGASPLAASAPFVQSRRSTVPLLLIVCLRPSTRKGERSLGSSSASVLAPCTRRPTDPIPSCSFAHCCLWWELAVWDGQGGSVRHSRLAAMGDGDVAVRPPRQRRERAVRAYPSAPFTRAFGLLALAWGGYL
jgi:hypothetical protein